MHTSHPRIPTTEIHGVMTYPRTTIGRGTGFILRRGRTGSSRLKESPATGGSR